MSRSDTVLRRLAAGEAIRAISTDADSEDLLARGLAFIEGDHLRITPAGRYAAQKPPAETSISITLSDGTSTGPVSLDAVREAVSTMKAADRKRRKAPPVRETDEDRAVSDSVYQITADELRQFVERYEQLDAEKKDVAGQQKELMGEAKGRGYDTKAIRKIVALRKRKPDDIAEEEAILDMYKAALGMA